MYTINRKLTPEEQEAYTLGQQAYRAGKNCAPVHDPLLTEMLRDKPMGHPLELPILKAWIAGWTTENLAAPLPDESRGE